MTNLWFILNKTFHFVRKLKVIGNYLTKNLLKTSLISFNLMKQNLAIKNNQFSAKDCRKFSNSGHSLLLCSKTIKELEIFIPFLYLCSISKV